MALHKANLVLVPILGLVGLVGSVARQEVARAALYEDVYYVPSPPALRIMTLGHREAVADILWCRALVYMGEEYGHQGTLRNVFNYTEAMLALDPDFVAVYRWIATAGVYQPNETEVADVWRTIELLERGRQRFPNDGPLAWATGATLSFELTPLVTGSERDDVRLRGAEHLMDAVRLGAAPEWLVLTNTGLLQELGQTERLTAHLEEMYATVSDERVRSEIAARIADVRTAAYEQAFTEANDQAEYERLRTFPYMHPSLFFLVGSDEREPVRLSDGVLEAETVDEE